MFYWNSISFLCSLKVCINFSGGKILIFTFFSMKILFMITVPLHFYVLTIISSTRWYTLKTQILVLLSVIFANPLCFENSNAWFQGILCRHQKEKHIYENTGSFWVHSPPLDPPLLHNALTKKTKPKLLAPDFLSLPLNCHYRHGVLIFFFSYFESLLESLESSSLKHHHLHKSALSLEYILLFHYYQRPFFLHGRMIIDFRFPTRF